MSGERFYWCRDHDRVEGAESACPPSQRMGPYASEEEARNWRQKVEARNEEWDREDREWEGEDDG